jgi:hypothetical protein
MLSKQAATSTQSLQSAIPPVPRHRAKESALMLVVNVA